MTDQLPLHVDLEPPVDPRDQVARMPGLDAPCLCSSPSCGFPFCEWKDAYDSEAEPA